MRERIEAYAPYIAWLGLFLILAGVLLPVYVRQTSTELPTWLPWALGIAGAALVLVWPLTRPADVRAALGARQTRFGGNALILSISVIGLLVVVNFLGTRRYAIWDLTSNKQYSISRQTVQILDDLDDVGRPITLTAVLSSMDQQASDDLGKLVDRYRVHTDKVTFVEIDPQVDSLKLMALAERIDMKDAPPSRALVAETGTRHEIVYTGFDEQSVTEAIVKVMREGKRKVAFTTGHDEYDPEGSGERGYSQVMAQLEREGYEVTKVNLTSITQTLAADTYDALIVAGARKPFLPQEARALAGYADGGGSLMVMVDPNVDANLGSVLSPWAISPNNDIVLQPSILGLSPMVMVSGSDYPFHTISKDLTNLNTVFSNARSLGVGEPVTQTLQVTTIAQVGERGEWGETDFAALQQSEVQQDPADTVPPLVVALAGEDTTTADTAEGDVAPVSETAGGHGRLVVFGTSALASDAFLQQFPSGTVANFDLFLNAVNWLAQEEALVSIRPTEPNDRPIERPSSPLLLLLSTAVLAPLAVLGVGTWLYWRRR